MNNLQPMYITISDYTFIFFNIKAMLKSLPISTQSLNIMSIYIITNWHPWTFSVHLSAKEFDKFHHELKMVVQILERPHIVRTNRVTNTSACAPMRYWLVAFSATIKIIMKAWCFRFMKLSSHPYYPYL